MALPRWMATAASVGALALVGAACSSDDDGEAAETTAPATTEAAPATMGDTNAAGSETTGTVVDVAASDDDFSTLVTAVQEAGLVETLSGEGPFTVFAPTNDAFDALPAGTLDSLLLEENRDQLAAVLTYHVVPTEAMSGQLTDGMQVTTVQGETLTIGVSDSGVTLTDASGSTVSVVQADVDASNGVIHAIDAVLLPAAG